MRPYCICLIILLKGKLLFQRQTLPCLFAWLNPDGDILLSRMSMSSFLSEVDCLRLNVGFISEFPPCNGLLKKPCLFHVFLWHQTDVEKVLIMSCQSTTMVRRVPAEQVVAVCADWCSVFCLRLLKHVDCPLMDFVPCTSAPLQTERRSTTKVRLWVGLKSNYGILLHLIENNNNVHPSKR